MEGQIAYHPIRVSNHSSLFLPYCLEELDRYWSDSLNSLRTHSSSKLSESENHRSPPNYSTPSPVLIKDLNNSNNSNNNSLTTSSNCQNQFNLRRKHQSTGQHHNHNHNKRIRLQAQSDLNYQHNHQTQIDSHFKVSSTVADYYNGRPNTSKTERVESPIFGVRKLNNWIKSVLIGKLGVSEDGQPNIRFNRINGKNHLYKKKVLELGCGKGGDLAKWDKVGINELFGFDIAEVSIRQARERYNRSFSKNFYAKYTALDCFSLPIESVLTRKELYRPFDLVSLQFCMHYAFETQSKARMMLENVSRNLRPGGIFMGTIPDPDNLMQRLDECRSEKEPRRDDQDDAFYNWGNSVYGIKFSKRDVEDFERVKGDDEDRQADGIYGLKYTFYLRDAVENVPEYVVFWDPFVKLAMEYGLRLIYKKKFEDIYEDEIRKINHNRDGYLDLLRRLRIIDQDGKILIDNDHWDVSS
ncbi:mRNA capping enzyme-domain-containing protein [Phakopsora pachyrhizi]|nr:mRNA capping enzyme-domain-containing protein [Phakopsora pachyrhizi]